MLTLTNVTKRYGKSDGIVHALDTVSLVVEPGEFVAVQGASGSGKTTLLLIAGGLLTPDEGVVQLDGQRPYDMSAGRRASLRAVTVGFVFQQFHLIPYLTVLENVLAASLAKSDGEAKNRASALIERLGLAERTHHVPGELSTGERQRTALARALLNEPRLLLADEPTGNLDDDNAKIVLDFMADFARKDGAVLWVTHNQQQIATADRTLKLNRGKLVDTSD